MTTLLVDKIEQEGNFAVTNNYDKFIYNIQLLGSNFYNDFQNKFIESGKKEHLEIIALGRFIVMVQQGSNKEETWMAFFDTQKNRTNALLSSNKFLSYPDGERIRSLFLQVHEIVATQYDKYYSEAELTLDTSPLS